MKFDIEKLVRIVSTIVDKRFEKLMANRDERLKATIEDAKADLREDVKTDLLRELVQAGGKGGEVGTSDPNVRKAIRDQDVKNDINQSLRDRVREDITNPDEPSEVNLQNVVGSIKERAESGDIPPDPDTMERQNPRQASPDQINEAFGDKDPMKRDYSALVKQFDKG